MKPVAEELEEMLWHVDENDSPLGSVNRKTAHDKKMLHREIALLIFDEQYRVLFQKRSMQKRSNPGMWSTSVAGHIRYGHKPLNEIVREAEEEVGLRGCDIAYKSKQLVDDGEETYFKYWYESQVPSEYKFDLNPHEVDEVRFYTPQELEQALQSNRRFNPIFVDYVKKFWERNR